MKQQMVLLFILSPNHKEKKPKPKPQTNYHNCNSWKCLGNDRLSIPCWKRGSTPHYLEALQQRNKVNEHVSENILNSELKTMFHLNFSKAIKELISDSKFGLLQNARK